MTTQFTIANVADATDARLVQREGFLLTAPAMYAEGLLPREMVARDAELVVVQNEMAARDLPVGASALDS